MLILHTIEELIEVLVIAIKIIYMSMSKCSLIHTLSLN